MMTPLQNLVSALQLIAVHLPGLSHPKTTLSNVAADNLGGSRGWFERGECVYNVFFSHNYLQVKTFELLDKWNNKDLQYISIVLLQFHSSNLIKMYGYRILRVLYFFYTVSKPWAWRMHWMNIITGNTSSPTLTFGSLYPAVCHRLQNTKVQRCQHYQTSLRVCPTSEEIWFGN